MSKSQVDVSVNERRLRPIYDCLDNGNNKKALQEADKVLKKQRDSQCAKVLKCLALMRLGKQEECLSLLNEVHAQSPTDDATLQAMSICYRDLNKPELIADCYEKAVKKEPQNEELISHLFMSYVRLGEYKKQQLTAMNLYKLRPKNPYYFWSIMSVYMQAVTSNDEKLSKNMFLPLAEKMVKKFVDEGKIEAEAEVELYLLILEKQKKYEEILNVLNGSLGNLIPNHLDFVSRRKAFILTNLGRWQEAFESLKSLVENNIDQLEYYLEWFKVAFILDETCEDTVANSGNVEFSHVKRVIDFVVKLTAKMKRHSSSPTRKSHMKICRGPYLAKIELFFFLKERETVNSYYGNLLKKISSSVTELFIEYFHKFGHKQCFFHDFTYLLSKYERIRVNFSAIIDEIKSLLNQSEEYPSSLDETYRHLSVLLLRYSAGEFDQYSDEEKYKLISTLFDHYDYCLKYGVDLLPSEFQPADNYCLLALHLLLEESLENNSTLFNALLVAERMLRKSTSNYNCRLLLVKLYNIIGAFSCSLENYELMDIKHIQQETLGYVISSSVISSAHFHTASQLFNIGLKFYASNYKDTFDSLISCYKFGSFTKVEDIIELRSKLRNSLQYYVNETEKMFSNLLLEVKSHQSLENTLLLFNIKPEQDSVEWECLCDNRDVSVFQCFKNDLMTVVNEKKTESFDDEVNWLKLRRLIIRSLIAAYFSVENVCRSEKENVVTNGVTTCPGYSQTFRRLASEFNSHCVTIESMRANRSLIPVQALQPSRLALYRSRSYWKVISKLMEVLLEIHNLKKEELYDVDCKSADLFATIVAEVIEEAKQSENLVAIGKSFEELTNVVETLNISVAFIDILCFTLKNRFGASKKSKKKKESVDKESTTIVSVVISQFEALCTSFEQAANNLVTFLKEWNVNKSLQFEVDSSKIKGQQIYMFETQGLNDTMTEVRKKIDASYCHSVKELSDVLNNKLKHLSTLKI
ncbi:N-alpha-acetyltransferase 25: NatB auxiliary subunit-like protein [Leptotrombidium deliense]|uniref:N-terminal acetyltransferase B complex subunit MDM20 homolog n=1 Tax=Leptotrombidium deliense TaxID=299467 RepID=A0A443SE93_9ACAR|nr:N-alpha-acetyltransferase 25: NatB auxiliary subunit-like protein [Leptotrombidium deliense]